MATQPPGEYIVKRLHATTGLPVYNLVEVVSVSTPDRMSIVRWWHFHGDTQIFRESEHPLGEVVGTVLRP